MTRSCGEWWAIQRRELCGNPIAGSEPAGTAESVVEGELELGPRARSHISPGSPRI